MKYLLSVSCITWLNNKYVKFHDYSLSSLKVMNHESFTKYIVKFYVPTFPVYANVVSTINFKDIEMLELWYLLCTKTLPYNPQFVQIRCQIKYLNSKTS